MPVLAEAGWFAAIRQNVAPLAVPAAPLHAAAANPRALDFRDVWAHTASHDGSILTVEGEGRLVMKTAKIVSSMVLALLALPLIALADTTVQATLSGYDEVTTLSSPASGQFKAKIGPNTIQYELTYQGFTDPDTQTVVQAHIHFGAPGINGGIVLFLCTNLGNAPPPPASVTQVCPQVSARLTGTLGPADVVAGATSQGISAGDFDAVVRAIRAGAAYVNVHTAARPSGEIRGQLQ